MEGLDAGREHVVARRQDHRIHDLVLVGHRHRIVLPMAADE
jgi:hypothetical protein